MQLAVMCWGLLHVASLSLGLFSIRPPSLGLLHVASLSLGLFSMPPETNIAHTKPSHSEQWWTQNTNQQPSQQKHNNVFHAARDQHCPHKTIPLRTVMNTEHKPTTITTKTQQSPQHQRWQSMGYSHRAGAAAVVIVGGCFCTNQTAITTKTQQLPQHQKWQNKGHSHRAGVAAVAIVVRGFAPHDGRGFRTAGLAPQLPATHAWGGHSRSRCPAKNITRNIRRAATSHHSIQQLLISWTN